MIRSIWLYELISREAQVSNTATLTDENRFLYLSNTFRRNLPLPSLFEFKMHQHVMMLHAKYTILYIKVQCHNGLMLEFHISVKSTKHFFFFFFLNDYFIRSAAALRSGHMREWIHNFPQKRQGFKKKGTFTYTHTHLHTHTEIHTHRCASIAHLSTSCFILITTHSHHHQLPARSEGGHIQCAVQVLFVRFFWAFLHTEPHPVSLLWI